MSRFNLNWFAILPPTTCTYLEADEAKRPVTYADGCLNKGAGLIERKRRTKVVGGELFR